ncbi:MAG: hypothetical protein ABS939_20360 [Psychrobacillus sp.]
MKWQFEILDIPENSSYPVKAMQVYDNGIKKGPFYLTIKDLTNALNSEPELLLDPEKAMKTETIVTPTLPVGTIRYSSNEAKTRERITIEIPKKQWDIRYRDNEDFFNIGFPRMIVQYVIATDSKDIKKIVETRLVAVLDDKRPIQEDTPLFMFPYPNVGKSNGIVCWGQNQRLEINNPTDLERSFQWFIASPFNEDHGVRTTLGIDNFRKLIEHIQDKPFQDDWLIPLNNQAFQDLF